MIYQFNGNDNENVKIFDTIFIENNKKKLKAILNHKEKELFQYKVYSEIEGRLLLKVKLYSKIINIEKMFFNCNLLGPFVIYNFEYVHIINMNNLFSGCSSLEDLEDYDTSFYISNWNTSKVKDMNNLFSGCSSLKYLPHINHWNTSNVEDISNLFSDCKNLQSIKDISCWDTRKVKNM